MAREHLIYDILAGRNTLSDKLKGATKEAGVLKGALSTAIGVVGGLAVTKDFDLFISGVRGSISSMREFIDAASIQEDAVNKLNTSLALTGGFSQEASADIQAFASALQSTTGIGDETTLQLTALARNFTSTTDEAIELTKAAVDLSAATGLSLEGSVKNLGKTFAGLTGELGESVPALRALTAEQLRAGEGVKLIADRFGGAAQANAKTFGGQLQILKADLGDLGETFGQVFTESGAFRGLLQGIGPLLLQFKQFVIDNKGALIDFVNGGVRFFVDSISFLASGIAEFGSYLQFQVNLITISFNAVTLAARAMALGIIEPLALAAEAINAIAGTEFSGLQEASNTLKEGISKDFKDMGEATQQFGLQDAAFKFEEFSSGVLTNLKNTVDQSKSLYAEDKDAFIQSLNDKIAAENEKNNQRLTNEQLLVESRKEFEAQRREDELLAKELEAEENFQFLSDNLGREQALREVQAAKELQDQGKVDAAKKKLAEARLKAEKESIFTVQKFDELSNKQRLANLQSTLGSIGTLTASSNKTLFGIAKAAAVSTATIDGIAGVQKALASAPPPFNFVLAALVGTATAVNVAKIASQQPPAFQDGGIVPGAAGIPRIGDNVLAAVNPGELILNEAQQDRIASRLGGDGLIERLLSQPIIVQIDGREIARTVRDQQLNGFALA